MENKNDRKGAIKKLKLLTFGSKSNVDTFRARLDEAFKTASDIIDEVQNDPSIPEREKMLVTVAAMTILMPKPNPHQHFKTAVSEDFIRELKEEKLKKKLITQAQADEVEDALAKSKIGFDTLDDFNHGYRAIGRLITTRKDYERVIKFTIEDAVILVLLLFVIQYITKATLNKSTLVDAIPPTPLPKK